MDQKFTSEDTSLPQVAGILKLVDKAYPRSPHEGDYGPGLRGRQV